MNITVSEAQVEAGAWAIGRAEGCINPRTGTWYTDVPTSAILRMRNHSRAVLEAAEAQQADREPNALRAHVRDLTGATDAELTELGGFRGESSDARQEAERIEQSNDIALTVIRVARDKAPGRFVTLDFRYGIADALWDAGYRKVAQGAQEPSDAEALEAARAILREMRNDNDFDPEYDYWEDAMRYAHAALLAARKVNRG